MGGRAVEGEEADAVGYEGEELVGEREEEGGLGRGHRRIRPLEGAWAEEGAAWEA